MSGIKLLTGISAEPEHSRISGGGQSRWPDRAIESSRLCRRGETITRHQSDTVPIGERVESPDIGGIT